MVIVMRNITNNYRSVTDGGHEMTGWQNVNLGQLTVVVGSASHPSSTVVLAARLLHGLSGGADPEAVLADWPTAPDEKHPLLALSTSGKRVRLSCDVTNLDPAAGVLLGEAPSATYEIQVGFDENGIPRILAEELTGPAPAYYSGETADRTLLKRVEKSTVLPWASSVAGIFGGFSGSRRHYSFISSGLVTPKLVRPMAYEGVGEQSPESPSWRAVVMAADLVVSALENITVLNPLADDVRRRGGGSVPRLYSSGAGTLDVLAYLQKVAPETYEVVQNATCPRKIDGNEFLDWASCVEEPLARFLAVATALVAPAECFATGVAATSKVKPGQVFIAVDEPLRGAPWICRPALSPLLQLCAQTRNKQILLATTDPDFLSAVRGEPGRWSVHNLH